MATVLTLLALSLVVTVVTAVLLSMLVRESDAAEQRSLDIVRAVGAPKFFEQRGPRTDRVLQPPVPLEVLLLQIEHHVRLEQAAAESFHLAPTVESLHRHTASPLVH